VIRLRRCREVRGFRQQPVCRLTNDAQVSQNAVLKQCASDELSLGFAGSISLDSFECFEDVLQVILGAFGMPAHTG
jgi:hypothetical protein